MLYREVLKMHRRSVIALVTVALVCGVIGWIGVMAVVDALMEPTAVTRVSDLEVTNKIQMTNTLGPTIKVITSDPNGAVTEPRGSIRLRTDTAVIYQNTDAATAWAPAVNAAGDHLTLSGTTLALSQIATQSFLGRTTAGVGNVETLTATQSTAILNTFTSGLKGLAPASGGGTVNFLRADGTWVTPTSSGAIGGSGTLNTIPKFTPDGTTIGNSSATDDATTFAINTNKFTVTEANGNTLVAGTLTVTPQTSGSVWFSGTAGLLSQDNSNFFWDNTNKRLGIGVAAAPTVTVDLKNTTTTEGVFQATLTSTSNNNAAAIGINASSTSGAMAIKNTNVNGPTDFYAQDNTGTSKMSWGYGNTSYGDTARVGRAYVWRNTGVNFVVARTNVVDAFWDSSGRFGFGTGTSLTGLIEANGTTPDIFINGSTSAVLRFSTNGAANPSFTTRSTGAKVVLFPAVDGSNVDYGFGIAAATLWSTIPQATSAFSYKWYGGTTNFASLDGTGQLSLVVTPAAATSDYLGILVNQAGTLNATAAQRISYGVKSVVTTTRSAGANNVINAALYGSVGSGQVNRALWTDDGEVLLNNLSGGTTINGLVSLGKHIRVTGTALVNGDLTSCGGGTPTASGTDVAGRITEGTTATGCVLTFKATYTSAPYCTCSSETNVAGVPVAVSCVSTATTLTFTNASATGDVMIFYCIGQSNGT